MPPGPPPASESSETDTLFDLLSSSSDETSESDRPTSATLEDLMQSIQDFLSQYCGEQGNSGAVVGFLIDVDG
jgi:hypothetical protein